MRLKRDETLSNCLDRPVSSSKCLLGKLAGTKKDQLSKLFVIISNYKRLLDNDFPKNACTVSEARQSWYDYLMKVKFSLLLAAAFAVTSSSAEALEARSSKDKNPVAVSNVDVNASIYILGPGDKILLEIDNAPEVNGIYTINPDGTIYLPKLRSLIVDGLTVEQFREFVSIEYRHFITDPSIYVSIAGYKPLRVYVGGEVYRHGYYTFPGLPANTKFPTQPGVQGNAKSNTVLFQSQQQPTQSPNSDLPKVYDAIKAAQGITPYSDLSNVKIIRRLPKGSNTSYATAVIDFAPVLDGRGETNNIILHDGDRIIVGKSLEENQAQVISASKSNISPSYINVYVNGRVKRPGLLQLPQGVTLNQAIVSAGGTLFLKGGVEFSRLSLSGSPDNRKFSFNPSSKEASYSNPVLMDGDIINVKSSLLSNGVDILNAVTGPVVGIYSVYSIFSPSSK